MRSKIIVPGIETKDVEPGRTYGHEFNKNGPPVCRRRDPANRSVDDSLIEYAKSRKIPILPFVDPQDPESTYISDYNRFYDQILETK